MPKANDIPDMTPEAIKLVAERFKVFSEPLRLRILQSLMKGERSVAEIAEAVDSSQPNVSKHLKILYENGVLSRQQDGNTVYYAIGDSSVFQLCDLVCNQLRHRFERNAEYFHEAEQEKA